MDEVLYALRWLRSRSAPLHALTLTALSVCSLPHAAPGQTARKLGNPPVVPPVEIKINKTGDPSDDDYVAVSDGTDDDLSTELSIKLTQNTTGNATANLSMKTSDGDIKFEPASVTLEPGVEVKVKMWGRTPSSAKDASVVVVNVRKGQAQVSKEETVTVFKGVKLEFFGNYYINVDTREVDRRPWDGRSDPKPNSTMDLTGDKRFIDGELGPSPTPAARAAYIKAVDDCLSFGYASAISFNDGPNPANPAPDNPEIPMYKPWKDALTVKVLSVRAITPDVAMGNDPVNGSLLEMKSGVLFGPDARETLVDPEIKVGDFFSLNNASTATQIEGKPNGPQSVTASNILGDIGAASELGYDELFAYLGRGGELGRPAVIASFSARRFEWKNDSFEVKPESKLTDSSAAKSIKGERDNGGKVEIKWIFADWNEFKFQGNLKDALITTK